MNNLVKTVRKHITKELLSLDSFGERLRQYFIAAGLIFCCSFVITLFHPTPLISKLVIATAFSLCFGFTIFAVIEWLTLLNRKLKPPIKYYPTYRFCLYSAVIFLLGFLIFSAVETYVMNLVESDFLDFYRENLPSYRPFSPLFLAKMSPIYIIIALNAIRALKTNLQHKKNRSDVKPESFQINLGSDIEILDPQTITHISVQEHYSRFYIKSRGTRKEIETHFSLTNALSKLPAEKFIRVHRSHAVNLLHVNGLRKIDNLPHIIIGEDEFIVPVSRRHYSEVRKKLGSGL